MTRRTAAKIGLVLLAASLMGAAYATGVLDQFADPGAVKRTLVSLGGWGYLAFVVAYAVLQPFGVPGTVFVWAAPLIWPWHVAFALSMVGTMAASVVGFSFARFIARDWVASRIPAKFKKYEDGLRRRAFATVVVLRFIFWMPPPLHFFLGVSPVSFWTHFWGSVVGYAVPLLLVSLFGKQVFDWVLAQPPLVWVGVGVAVVVLVATWWLKKRRGAEVGSAP